MPFLRIILIALAILIAINIPTIALPVFMSEPGGKVASPFFWMILAGFGLAPIAVPFIFRSSSNGLIILLLATILVLVGALMLPNAMQGSSAMWKAFNFASGHFLMLLLAASYCILHKHKKPNTEGRFAACGQNHPELKEPVGKTGEKCLAEEAGGNGSRDAPTTFSHGSIRFGLTDGRVAVGCSYKQQSTSE